MSIAMKAVLLIFVLFASAILYTILFAIGVLTVTGAKATGLPALLQEPLYWLIMILVLGGELWLAVHRVKW